jgi:hypothetical protein
MNLKMGDCSTYVGFEGNGIGRIRLTQEACSVVELLNENKIKLVAKTYGYFSSV